ncbi:MAG: methionine--tRNA ligase [candidate division NC10 bacterium]|nr:methionine--tRNA ligase [candidate division NC10 bacterium]
MTRFYITTPIYYVNATPHLGHAYTTILADATARFHRLLGEEVYFLTGTDEHGDKIAQAAAAAGEGPQAYVDRISGIFQETWRRLQITHDQFIRTTAAPHRKVVQAILQKIHDRGEIYFGEYGGQYCFGCERFYTERELVDGKCPDHLTVPTYIKEQNYFFRMSRYQERLLKHLAAHPECIRPERYRNEVLAFLKEPLEDLCISRPKARLQWGIPLPFDDRYVTYVWFDALINYVSALGYPDGDLYAKFWGTEQEPIAQHLIGKDILKPHGIYWPTMLWAAGIPVYRHLNVHGYWTVETGKMSKSRGAVVRPLDLVDQYGYDAFRYFLLREMVFGLDATFSEEALVARLNADLANDLGNLVSRACTMLERYLEGRVPKPAPPMAGLEMELPRTVEGAKAAARSAVEQVAWHRALEAAWEIVTLANRYIDSAKPWELAKGRPADLERVLYHLWEAIRQAALLLSPAMPDACAAIWERLGITLPILDARLPSEGKWGAPVPTGRVQKGEALFPRVETDAIRAKVAAAQGRTAGGGAGRRTRGEREGDPGLLTAEEFGRLDLRGAVVRAAEAVPKSKRLVTLRVDLGGEERTVVAGILQHYAPEALIGRQVILVANLAPATLMGVTSQGMVLAAEAPDGRIVLLLPDREVPPGSPVK